MDLLTRSLFMTAGGKALDTTVEFVGSSNKQVPNGTSSGSGTTITLSGLQADDVVFLTYTSEAILDGTLNTNSTDLSSSTWTQVSESSASNPAIGLWHTVSTGTSVTVDVEYAPTSDAQAYVLCLYAFRGCNTTNPIYANGRERSFSALDIPLTDIDPPPSFDTYAVGFVSLDDDVNVTFSMPGGYTEIFQGESSGDNGDNATMAIAYGPLYADTAITGKTFTVNTADTANTFHYFLIPDGKDGAPPVITGSSAVVAASGGTTVATYTADKAVTWSLAETDTSVFSISSGGVVTYNSTSTPSSYEITVMADNADGLRSYLAVSVQAYSSGGTAGGGITMVASTSGTTDSAVNDPLTLTLSSLQSGDVVFFTYASDSFGSASTFKESDNSTESLAGYTQVDTSYSASGPANTLFYKAVTSTSESLEFIGKTSSTRSAIGLFAFRGVDNTDPIIEVETVATSTSTTVSVPDHFILADSVEVVVAGLDDDGGETSTPPTGYTEIIDQNVQTTSSASNSALIHVSSKDVNGNTTESSRAVSFSSSDGNFGYSFTLRPD